ncbi:MAG TPA: endonuclease MutS2 [Bdellovibrionales bacterium]|nr:endonuclease MutS2 [Pseudobdellovibrionaceae bacterium]HAG91901.1 endonuclease MutS2 [Bdellovibrionales bacterium]
MGTDLEKKNRLAGLDWIEIKERLSQLGTCELSRSSLKALSPLNSVDEIKELHQKTFEALNVFRAGRRPFMESLDLYSVWATRLEKEAVLKTTELRDTRHFLIECLALKEIVSLQESDWMQELNQQLMEAEEPLSAIDQIMTSDGAIRTDASELLYKLHTEKKNLVKQVQNTLDRLVHQHEMEPVLQDRYVTNREGRWVLPVKSGKQHDFSGIIHASSHSRQTVFMEPQEIVPMNNRLREVEVEIEAEIERLLSDLSDYLRTQLSDMNASKELMLESDQIWAKAQLAAQLSANPIEFSEDLELHEVRHPILVLNNVEVISNTVHLNPEKRILILSGPNAGGKTILLKSVGLAAQMARCGLFVCAEPQSKIPFFKKIQVAVGDSQSVDENLSTFAAHLKILNESLDLSGHQNLLLIDEICGSTDPEEGAALARAFLQKYSDQNVFGVVTSHLSPLKVGWKEDSGVINGSLAYDNEAGKPTFHFLMGIPGKSLALQTAKRVGVRSEVLDLAMEALSPDAKKYHAGLEEVEKMKSDLQHIKTELKDQVKKAKADQSRYHAMLEKFEKEKAERLEHSLKKAQKRVDEIIEQSKVANVFRRHEELEKVKSELPEIIKASKVSRSEGHQVRTPEDFGRAYPPGTRVFVPTIGRDGVVQGAPNSKGEVPILSQSMRLMVHWESLKAPHQANNPTREVLKHRSDTSTFLEKDAEIDLRGKSTEDALSRLEAFLDQSVLNKEDRVKVIHGHGTDTLKKAIRSYLSRSNYVKNWKAGTPNSGGDGITWVEIFF